MRKVLGEKKCKERKKEYSEKMTIAVSQSSSWEYHVLICPISGPEHKDVQLHIKDY